MNILPTQRIDSEFSYMDRLRRPATHRLRIFATETRDHPDHGPVPPLRLPKRHELDRRSHERLARRAYRDTARPDGGDRALRRPRTHSSRSAAARARKRARDLRPCDLCGWLRWLLARAELGASFKSERGRADRIAASVSALLRTLRVPIRGCSKPNIWRERHYPCLGSQRWSNEQPGWRFHQ